MRRASLGGRVDHLRRIVGGSTARRRDRGNQAGESNRAEVDLAPHLVYGQLLVMARVIRAQQFTVEFVAAIHRRGRIELIFTHAARASLGIERRQPISGDRRGIQEYHRPAVRFALLLGEFEHHQRAFDIHLVCRHRGELPAC